jgi:two-component system, sensor histidine kinase and response regulator
MFIGINMELKNKGLHILIAEDNLVNQKLATRLLEKQGHTSMIANNGREAVEAWETEAFDAVLMDMQMPVMDGIEATKEIRAKELNLGKHVPIIAMTANAMIGDRERCLEAGMDEYLPKPVDVSKLAEVLEKINPQASQM